MSKNILVVLAFMLLLSSLVSAGNIAINSVSYAPAPVQPGGILIVWVQVKNDSLYSGENVLVQLDPEFPFSIQAGEPVEQNLGVLGRHQTATAKFNLLVDQKATDGTYSLKVLVGEEFVSKEEAHSITVLSRTPKLEIVESSVSQLSPGETETVQFTVKNIGGGIARNIVLKVNPERTVTSTGIVVEREIVSLGAISNYIEYLGQNEETDVQMTLAVNQDAELKNYSVPVTIEYYDVNGTAKTDTGYFGIKVSADAEVDTVINSVEPKAFAGGTSEIVVDLFNIGLADARYVVIELAGPNATIAEPRQFIGTLEADDFDSFKTKISFDPTTGVGNLPLTLKIMYKDEQLEEQVITKTLFVNVVSPGEAIDGGGGPGIILIGLISLALQLIGLYIVARWAYPRAKLLMQRVKKK